MWAVIMHSWHSFNSISPQDQVGWRVQVAYCCMQVRQRATGMVLIVAESRLSQLPTIKTKVETSTKVKGDMANSGAPKDKSAPKHKGAVKKGENDESPPPVDTTSYEVIGQYKGSDLVGKK